MRLRDGRGAVHQLVFLYDARWQAVGNLAVKPFQCSPNDPAQDARSERRHGFINGNDAIDFQRTAALGFLIGQDLKLWLDNFQGSRAVAVAIDLAVEERLLAGVEDFVPFQVAAVEPFAPQHAGGIARRQVVNFQAAAGAHQAAGQNFGKDRRGLSGNQVADARHTRAVLVAEGCVVKQVLHRANAALGEKLRTLGTHTFEKLNLGCGGKFGVRHSSPTGLL